MKRLMVLGIGIVFFGAGTSGEALGQKKAPSVAVPKLSEIPAVTAQLKDKEVKVRIQAATRLGARAQLRARDIKNAIAPLLGMAMSDTDAVARRAAALALSKADADPKEVLQPLIEVLKNDKDFTVRAAAAKALGSLGPGGKPAVPALQEAQAETKGASKAEKDKQALGRAAGAALKQITGGKKK